MAPDPFLFSLCAIGRSSCQYFTNSFLLWVLVNFSLILGGVGRKAKNIVISFYLYGVKLFSWNTKKSLAFFSQFSNDQGQISIYVITVDGFSTTASDWGLTQGNSRTYKDLIRLRRIWRDGFTNILVTNIHSSRYSFKDSSNSRKTLHSLSFFSYSKSINRGFVSN